jgi:4-amino-4-deoxyprephenate dehydrogenase
MAIHAGDVTRPDDTLLNAITRCDCVLVSLPERTALAAAERIIDAMSERALWVDTLSVKQRICGILESSRGDVEKVSINPMFAPSLGIAGNTVAFIEVLGGDRSRQFAQTLRSLGASVEAMSAEAHDRLTAAVQVATHAAVVAFGAALLEMNFDAEKSLAITSPPHLLLLSLLSRINTATPEVYWEIQHYHPHAAVVRAGLRRAIAALDDASDAESPAGYERLFELVRLMLAPKQDMLRETSSRLTAEARSKATGPTQTTGCQPYTGQEDCSVR